MAEPKFAIDRVAFLLAFVPYLTRSGPISVEEAAAHFGVDPAYVRKAARQLPFLGRPAAEGDPLPNDLFDIDWEALEEEDVLVLTNRVEIDREVPQLAGREAAALLAGLRVIGADPVIGASDAYARLRAKLAAGASDVPGIAVEDAPHLGVLREAILAGLTVVIDYRSDEVTTHREVEPLRLETLESGVVLRGWCRMRGEVRTFRLDRIAVVERTRNPIEHDVAVLDESPAGYQPGEDDPLVEFELPTAALPLIHGYRPVAVEATEQPGWSWAQLRIGSAAAVRRMLAEVPGSVVVAPESVREDVAAWAGNALGRYSPGDPAPVQTGVGE